VREESQSVCYKEFPLIRNLKTNFRSL
jgi:hypothetical protein